MEKQPTTTFETMPEPKPSVAPQPSGTLRPPAPPSVRPSRPSPPVSARPTAPAASLRPPTTHSAPPPPPPAPRPTLREDGTQQIDISQIEEMRPAGMAKRVASVPPPTPGAASSAPPPPPPVVAKPARLAEKTQPIRLDQILAVNNARRAAASSPPPAYKEPAREPPAVARAPIAQPPLPGPAVVAHASSADHDDDDPLGFDDEASYDDDDASDNEKTMVAQSPIGTAAVSPSLSQRPLFSVQDEPFSPSEREAPALFATPSAARPAASTEDDEQDERDEQDEHDGEDQGDDSLSAALPSASALRAGPARKQTLLGMGNDPGKRLPAFDPSLELPTLELRTRELNPSHTGGGAERLAERDHPTERVSLVTPSEASERDSNLDASLSITESELPGGRGVFGDSRRLVMYASAALVGLALVGVGASALRSGPEASATRAAEPGVPPPLPATLSAASAPEPTAPAVALAEAPHPIVEPLAPSVTPLGANTTPEVSAAIGDLASQASAAGTEPVPSAPVTVASLEASAEPKHTHHHHHRSSKHDDADDSARASSKARDASASHGKSASANAKSSTKSAAADKGADKAALFAAARDEARNAYAAKNYKDAAAAYERAAKYDPKHPGTFAGLGAARLQLGDNKAAVQAYQRAVQLSPDTSGFHAALGRGYLALGDKAKALGAYKKALSLDPKNEAAKTAIKQLGG